MGFRINRRQLILLISDAFLVATSFYFALLLRFDFVIQEPYLAQYQQQLMLLTLLWLISFHVCGLYRQLWQYASVDELTLVVTAVTFGIAIIYTYTNILASPFPRSVYIIAWILNIALIGGTRFTLRLVRRTRVNGNADHFSHVLIVGAGCAGTIVVNELQKHVSTQQRKVIGYIDDESSKQYCSIQGIKVLGTRHVIPDVVKTHNVDEIIITMPSATKEDIRDITQICSQLPVKLSILPGVYEILNGDVTINKIRPIEIEDLLGREEVIVNLDEIVGYLEEETVLITGAGGSIGSELCRQIASFKPKKLILLDHTENNVYDIEMELQNLCPTCELIPTVADVRDHKRINSIFETYKPTVIFHAAAHKHVPLMECNRPEAIQNNIFGTKNLAEAADRHNAKSFLLISTDKAVKPTSVMGATKRVAEMTIQMLAKKSSTRFCAVRFGNVLGSRGSVLPLFKKQIEAGGPVTVTHPDMTRYFMTIPEAVQLVIQAGAMGKKGEIFILDMGKPVKITDLAQTIIRLSGFEPNKDIHISYTGIRPGEKLFEEVLTSEEGTKTTKHKRIFIAKATDMNNASVIQELIHLTSILKFDLKTYNEQFAEIFPETKALG